MRFVIYGAGGIGGAIGGRLHQAGHDVMLVARGDHLGRSARARAHAAVARRDRGAARPGGRLTRPRPGCGPGDVVVLAMKSQHTPAAVAELAGVAPPGIAVACAQNGVDNERAALRSFADVYGIAVMLPATHLAPGVVDAWSTPVTGLLDIGRYPAGVDATAEAVAGRLRRRRRSTRWPAPTSCGGSTAS